MDNFDVFDKTKLAAALEPFAPNISNYITPIKYEALTPDVFALLFRTTAKDGAHHFFVLLEYDYMEDLDEIKQTITEWHGHILDFWAPQGHKPQDFATEREYLEYTSRKSYKTVLAHVEKPKGKGYWANCFVIRPGDDIHKALAHASPKQQAAAKKSLDRLLQQYPDLQNSLISVYLREDGRVELFYN